LARHTVDAAYPEIQFLPSSRNWWAWLKGTPAECVHIERDSRWTAILLPDTLYLQGKRAARREPARPEVSLCCDCLARTVHCELKDYGGRVIAFEPDPEVFTQYFFVGTPDFDAAGVAPEVSQAIQARLDQPAGSCGQCAAPGNWLWFSRQQVESLDEVDRIAQSPGESLCAAHGTQKLLEAFRRIPEANLFYVNLPYGEAGAYVWI